MKAILDKLFHPYPTPQQQSKVDIPVVSYLPHLYMYNLQIHQHIRDGSG
jgi:hypothetical protein